MGENDRDLEDCLWLLHLLQVLFRQEPRSSLPRYTFDTFDSALMKVETFERLVSLSSICVDAWLSLSVRVPVITLLSYNRFGVQSSEIPYNSV